MGQTVLKLELVYKLKDRKPYEVVRIIFDKSTFEENGIYDYREESLSDEGIRFYLTH